MKRKFWNWIRNEDESVPDMERTLFLNGMISDETWYGDEVTPQLFKDELNAGNGNITVWINSPGGDVFAAAQIYNMLRDYKGSVTVKIDGIAASAASVIAMAGDTVCVSPVAMMMIHNPATMAMGEAKDMQKAIAMLNEVKESILNAYEFKTGLTRARLSHMMDDETWFNAKKAVELGFADKILFDSDEDEKKKKPDEPEEKPEKGSDGSKHTEFLSVPAVVIRKNNGCVLASPEPLVMTSNSSRFGCACSSSKMTAWTFRPCLVYASADST